jgi:hypothetical protein
MFAAGVLKPQLYSVKTHGKSKIFNSRMVREVKGKNTPLPYEKSRLIIQGYNDNDKKNILTKSPIIQRCSQRLIFAIAPTLIMQGMQLCLRDITQAYPQSRDPLQRVILAHLPKELKRKYPDGTILRVIKPLYGIAEAGVHWFDTYQPSPDNRLQKA